MAKRMARVRGRRELKPAKEKESIPTGQGAATFEGDCKRFLGNMSEVGGRVGSTVAGEDDLAEDGQVGGLLLNQPEELLQQRAKKWNR